MQEQGQTTFFLAGAIAALAAIGGCAGQAAPEPRSYDLGLDAPAAHLALRIGTVRAAAPFDSSDMVYRLAYRNAAEVGVYANSRWAATPSEMLKRQLQRAADGGGKCTLDVEIQEFSQVFAAAKTSEARIEVQARLTPDGAQQRFAITEAGAGPDAPSGAAAMARATDRLVADLGGWAASQPACR
ncbi:MAG TPA: ABC-type transport auxiliary lipoprotein family protein [Burkholderiales bacterium]|nr:ABC-type transport auxiliary lipoprotein family protein [Burkholderiales bacterium]